MTIQNYTEHINQLVQEIGVSEAEIFNPEFSPNLEEYLNIFSFYQEALLHNNDFGIEPAYLFFKNDFSLNAAATKTLNDVYLVSINMGTINWLIDRLKTNSALVEETDINLFRILSPYLDIPINRLLYQACCHFTFYHEMGHLIQNSDLLLDTLRENPNGNVNYDFNRHLLEIDADTFSALCLGTHIFQYCDRLFGENFSQEQLEGLVVLFSISIFLYLISFPGNSCEFYLRESTHPHPALRITNLLMVLTHYCNNSLDSRNSGFTINQGNMFIYAMEIAEELQDFFFEAPLVSNYRQTMIDNRIEAITYLSEIVDANNELEITATSKWNIRHANQ
ncbi:conserved protein of unknown function [Tenacibaculum sp. 190524A02b]|uniref:hypothetical protein n=1 Tax=Tenacibaculum vairaonense TaxID=3137860 RepID=UPI0032B13AE4